MCIKLTPSRPFWCVCIKPTYMSVLNPLLYYILYTISLYHLLTPLSLYPLQIGSTITFNAQSRVVFKVRTMYDVLCTTYYVLCVVYYVLCTMYYLLCTMHYNPNNTYVLINTNVCNTLLQKTAWAVQSW
jgi:hypothetical protein